MEIDEKAQYNYYPIDIEVSQSKDEPETNTKASAISETNIITAGGGSVLNGGDFVSPNYSKGVSGWKIDSNGSVEFGSGFFRGDITGASGTFS